MLFNLDDHRTFWAKVGEWDQNTGKLFPVYTKGVVAGGSPPEWVNPTSAYGFSCHLETLSICVKVYEGPQVQNMPRSKSWVFLRFEGLGVWRMCAQSDPEEGDGLACLRTPEALEALDLHSVLVEAQRVLLSVDKKDPVRDPQSEAAIARTLKEVERMLVIQDKALPWRDMMRKFSMWFARKVSATPV